MSNELQIIQKELQISKQEAEIYKLKLELQKVQAQKLTKLEDSLYSQHLYDHYMKVANTLANSGMVPKQYIGKPTDVFVAMAMGYKLGFSVEQSLQDIAVINGRPSLWGDGMLALVQAHPEFENKEETPIYKDGILFGYKCVIWRKGKSPAEQIFTLENAKRAGYLSKQGPWQTVPERMLQLRARAFALRDSFSDALRGIKSAEEETDIIASSSLDAQTVNVEFKAEDTQTEKLKSILSTSEEVSEEVFLEQKIQELKDRIQDKNVADDKIQQVFEHFQVTKFEDLTDKQIVNFHKFLDRN